MKTPTPHPARRVLAGLMAFLIGFGPMTPMAYAATTKLADGPIAVNIKAKPNILYTLDDSTSMNLDFLPDYVVINTATNTATTHCRSATGLTACGFVGNATIPQYVYAEWGIPTGAAATFPFAAGYGNSSYGPPAVMASAFNAVFYNPAVTYIAPLKFDGTSYADMNATNTTNWTQVPADPFLFPTKYVNLRTKVSVGVWCNTTYAGNFTLPNGVAADRDGLAIGGNHCRINGFPYTLGANAAPAVDGDYNYPYARNAAGPPNANFFDKTSRTIHCDPSRMNGFNSAGTAQVAPTAPTCDACAKTCPVAQVVDPANPPGCDLGCTNPAECTICGLKCPVATTYNCAMNCSTAALNCAAVGGGTWAAQPQACAPGANQKCTPHPGACATTGAWTLNAAACNTVITGVSKNQLTDPVPAATIGKTLEQDANFAGDVCRRNNFTYSNGTADGWRYPDPAPVAPGKYTTAIACPGAITATINRHYYKASVQWCDAKLAAGTNDKWRSFGTGNCRADKSPTFQFPRYIKSDHTGAALDTVQDNYTGNPAFELIELDFLNSKIIVRNGTPGTSITHVTNVPNTGDSITRDSTSTTPAASELVNYANWFAYYRTRMLASKSVTALAFSELTDKFRVGFHTLSNAATSSQFLTIADFTGGTGFHRESWFAKLFGQKVPMGNDTPLLSGMARIGEWFKSSTGTHVDLTGSTDPIVLSCQKNFHIMFTDGYTNQSAKATPLVTNIDGAVIPPTAPDTMPVPIIDLIPGTAWPNIIKEGSVAVDDSLSDYALYYWMKDLRPPTFAAAVSDNNVPTNEKDPAKWQHINFAGLALGTEGVLPSRDPKAVEDQITAGTLTWTKPAPTVFQPGVTGVDDLWHAAIAGRSQFVNARDPVELQAGLTSILQEISRAQGSRAGAAFGTVNFTASGNFGYRVTIEPDFGGTLTRVGIHPDGSGEIIGTAFKYHDMLLAQVTPASAGDEPWYDNRRVVTKTSPGTGAAVPFRIAELTTAGLHTTLGTTAVRQKQVIDFLRGDRSNEGRRLSNFRERSQVLGGIVNSSPVVVGPPKAPFSNATDPGYETFKSTYSSRMKMVYVGANDGMLHAFDEVNGTELWAYVPSFMYSSVADKGLAALTKKDPFFKHQMFVDSTPVAADVDIGGTWKTVLVGGLGKGGKGFYAIDITEPGSITNEADAASKVMWEFTDTTSGSELGYSYGKPLIAKTYAHGWVVIVTSGHNSGGTGKLYVLSLADGSVLKTLDTGVGSSTTPSGLAQISGFVLTYKNQYLEQIYGGDLLGNVWRFDVSSSLPASWTVAKLAELRSATADINGSFVQAVTMAPQIEVDLSNGIDRYVMVGTGRLLDDSDLVDYASQQQTMYVIRDGTVLAMNTAGLPHTPRTDTGFSVLTDTLNGFPGLSVKGWYHDLPVGERIVTPIAAELNFLGYAGSLPPINECIPGLSANIYVRQFPNAESVLVDSGGAAVASTASAEGAVGMDFVNIFQSDPTYPTLKLAITLGTDGRAMFIPLANPNIAGDHRMSWRLLGR